MPDEILSKYNIVADNVPGYVAILRRPTEYIPIYEVNFLHVTSATDAVLTAIKEKIIEKVKVKLSEIVDPKAYAEIKARFMAGAQEVILGELPKISSEERQALAGYLVHEMLGLGKLEVLLNDDALEEIVVNNSSEPLYVYHKKFGWLKTNIMIPTEEQIYNYSSIIGRKVGRQITNLNPLMDAHLPTGDRVNATLFPISTKGNTITIRKFRREPWTIIHLIEDKTLNAEIAALLWLSIQYELNIIVAGGTASGKTTLLNSLMPFVPTNHRVISIEDSISGEEEILIRENNVVKKTQVKELVDREIEEGGHFVHETEVADNTKGIEILSMKKDGKIEISKPNSFIRHKVKKKMLEIKLATGKKIKVTADHSLFGLSEDCEISPVSVSKLSVGDFIATPRTFRFFGDRDEIDITENIQRLEGLFVFGEPIKEILRGKKIRDIVRSNSSKSLLRNYVRKAILPVEIFSKLLKEPELQNIDNRRIFLRSKIAGAAIPLKFKITEDLAFIFGNWIADGSYDKNSIIISADDEESREIIRRAAKIFMIETKMHSDGISLMLNSSALKKVFVSLGFFGNAYTKKIPNFVYNLKEELQAKFLSGILSGDGWVRKNEIAISLASMELIKNLQNLLLNFGIILRFTEHQRKDKCYEARISGAKFLKKYFEEIGFSQSYKNEKLKIAMEKSLHEISDIVPLPKHFYREFKKKFRNEMNYKSWKSWHTPYLHGTNIGREHLKNIIEKIPADGAGNIANLVTNDIFWDRVVGISEFEHDGYVYDFSVHGNESFICNNVIAHNTRELMLPQFLHWIPLTTREANPEGRGEITMLDLLVNSLRMRPDRVVLGEIRRQREAEVLFEAMHTGHSVYSTFHADRAEQVLRRLTNPPISLPESLLESLHMVITQFRHRKLGIRRTFQLGEIIVDGDGGRDTEIGLNILYQWNPKNDSIEKVHESKRLMEELKLHTGMGIEEVKKDLLEKQEIFKWMIENKIKTVNAVGKVIADYYANRQKVLDIVSKKGKPEEILGAELIKEISKGSA